MTDASNFASKYVGGGWQAGLRGRDIVVAANSRPWSQRQTMLQEDVVRYQQEQGLQITLTLPQGKDRLPAPLETTLFRVIQEALTNAARHAKASHVEVNLDWDAAQVTLRIADDGQGFDPREAAARAKGGRHLGLWSMRSRMEQVGGRLQFDSRPGGETTIQATIPLPVHTS